MKRFWSIAAVGFVAAVLVALRAAGSPPFTADQANTAAPGSVNVAGVSAAPGTSRFFARADHVHSITGVTVEANGGTHQSTYAQGDILYASAANTLSKLAKGTSGQVLQQGATVPAWAGETAWTAPTLTSGYANNGAPFITVGYLKDAAGVIHLRGNALNSAGTAAGNPIFQLAVGYRPSARVVYAVPSGTVTTTFTRVDIDATGFVFNDNATAAGAYVALDGITFDTR